MEDAVRPSQDAYRGVYERGYRTWAALWQREEEAANDSPFETSSIYSAFPNHPYFPSRLLLDKSLSNVVVASGRSTWNTTTSPADPRCELPPFQEQMNMQVAWNFPTEVVLRQDQGLLDKKLPALFAREDSHHFPVLFLAWAYILSARWAELIPGAQEPTYNQDTRAPSTASAGHHDDDDDDDDALPAHPCTIHEAALAAALLIPIAKLDGARIELPSPKPRCDGAPAAAAAAPSSQDGQAYLPWDEEDGEEEHPQPLDRLLTLSCHPRGAKALLSSIFFQPDIDCNLCGAWLQGSFAFLDSDAAQEPQLRLRTFVRRDPGLAFLWLGAFITGAEARCVQDARAGWWKTDLSSAAWTGTHVSFIQGTVTKPPPAAAADISRADECRLMYLAHGPTHAVPPLFPFAPFGRTALQDADLDVRQHTQCPALHRLVYAGFVWDCRGGGRNVKQGACGDGVADDAALIRVKASELSRVAEVDDTIAVDYSGLDREDGDEMSEIVTRNIFCWLRGDDGYPVAERALRQHDWINDADSDDDNDDDGPGQGREDSRSLFGDTRLSRWLLGVATGRCNSL
ncbi:immunoglobulin variable region used by the ITC63B heavy chain [Colletotrichum tabaci]|uniref:Immunoglobulin variable region used by the ITC63B heavy chain n=1 Tax=Colletotrichum tabaci TaxID=1209068 RepID=A0AAV9TF85_9PEZI